MDTEQQEYYSSLFKKNHSVMLLIDPETADVVDANDAACSYYGYCYEKLTGGMKISDINTLTRKEVFKEMERARKAECRYFLFKHRLADGQIRDVEVYSGSIAVEGRQLLYSVVFDISEKQRFAKALKEREQQILEYSRLLEGILKGIPDIIGVYNPDQSVIMYNQAGYEFYGKKPEEAVGKSCYELCGRSCRCEICTTEKVMKEKKLVRYEKYIPELGKYMECSGNPVFGDDGSIVYIIEQLRDITERKQVEMALQESEKQYRSLVELSPDAILVFDAEAHIILANHSAEVLFQSAASGLTGKSLFEFIHPAYHDIARKRMSMVVKDAAVTRPLEYRLILPNGSAAYAEISSTPFEYKGAQAVQSVIRDITLKKMEMEKAAAIQKQRLMTHFPIPERAEMQTVYLPAKHVSGDFFELYRSGPDTVTGIIGDVSGKGITAALSVSAMRVLFYEAASLSKDPVAVLHQLNREAMRHFKEEYIAACCFCIDFSSQEITAAGAGINEFMFFSGTEGWQRKFIRGPFLGMFGNNWFEQLKLCFRPGDKLFLYTDGLEQLFFDETAALAIHGEMDMEIYKNAIQEQLQNEPELWDDCTWIGLSFK